MCCWNEHYLCGEWSRLNKLLMYHELTFSIENGPRPTFSCGTDGDLIKMNGPLTWLRGSIDIITLWIVNVLLV
jgi:hypothetical protein